MTLKEYKSNIKKVKCKRNSKIKNSYGILDGFIYYRENKKAQNKPFLKKKEYFKITRMVNNLLREKFSNGEIDIVLPAHLGNIELRKYPVIKRIVDGKLVTNSRIDWNKTLELWYEDQEAFDNRTLIRTTSNVKFKIHYNKDKAQYIGKSYFDFSANRELKNMLKKNIRDNKIDAYTYY